MKTAELQMHIKNTNWFIQQNPVTVVLNRAGRVRTLSGGYMDGEVPLDPQVFRLIEPGSATSPQFLAGQDGQQRSVEYWLLGMPNADVEIDDWWVDPITGRNFQVGDIVRPNGYETRAIVTERGK